VLGEKHIPPLSTTNHMDLPGIEPGPLQSQTT